MLEMYPYAEHAAPRSSRYRQTPGLLSETSVAENAFFVFWIRRLLDVVAADFASGVIRAGVIFRYLAF